MNIQLQLITKLFLSSFLFLEAREKKLFKKWEDVEKKKNDLPRCPFIQGGAFCIANRTTRVKALEGNGDEGSLSAQ